MTKYFGTAKHTFKSENNLKKHLKSDEKYFLKIVDKLKKVIVSYKEKEKKTFPLNPIKKILRFIDNGKYRYLKSKKNKV